MHSFCRYFGLIQANKSAVPVVNVRELGKTVPLPPPPPNCPRVLVMGGLSDYVVDEEGLRETAGHWGVKLCLLPDLAHDAMLASYLLSLDISIPGNNKGCAMNLVLDSGRWFIDNKTVVDNKES